MCTSSGLLIARSPDEFACRMTLTGTEIFNLSTLELSDRIGSEIKFDHQEIRKTPIMTSTSDHVV